VNAASVGEKKNIKYILFDKSQRKRPFETPRHR
jgi:hypothetical protein